MLFSRFVAAAIAVISLAAAAIAQSGATVTRTRRVPAALCFSTRQEAPSEPRLRLLWGPGKWRRPAFHSQAPGAPASAL